MSENNEAGNGSNKPVSKWKKPMDKKTWLAMIVVFVIVVIVILNSEKNNSGNQQPVPASTKQQVAVQAPDTRTPEQKPEDDLKSQLQQAVANIKSDSQIANVTGFSYKDLQIEQADKDRPTGTKMVTVSINVGKILDKKSFIWDTGGLSAKLFQAVFSSQIPTYDAFVWYYGDTTDTYGNPSNKVIQTYHLDKSTYAKINWSNFDEMNFCGFLNQEDQRTGGNLNTGCVTLVNIQ